MSDDSVYPGALDTIADDKTNRTRNPSDHPSHHNHMAKAIKAVQAALGINPQGDFADVADRLDHEDRVAEFTFADTLAFTAPEIAPIFDFSLTAKSTEVIIEVEVAATVAGIAHAVFSLFVGPAGTELVPGSQDSWVLASGVVGHDVGSIDGLPVSKFRNPANVNSPLPSAAGFVSRKVRLTGLTKGDDYDGQITCGIVGNAQAVACGAHAGAVAISQLEGGMGHLLGLVRNNNDVTVSVVLIGHQAQTPHDEKIIDLALPGSSGDSGDVAFTPLTVPGSGGQGVVVNQLDGSITTIDFTTSLLPAILDSRKVVPGSTPNPIGVTVVGTNAYIYCFSTDKIEVYDLVGRAFTSTISLAASSAPTRGVVTPDGLYLLVVCNGTGKIAKVKLSDSTVTYSAVLGGGVNQHPADVAVTPDGVTAWAVTRTDDNAYPVTVSSLAVGSPVALGYHPIRAKITPDGKALLVSSDTASVGKQITHLNLTKSPPVVYTRFGNSIDATDTGFPAGGFDLGPDGSIYITQRDASLLNCYFAATARIRPGSDVGTSFHGERLTVRVIGADA